MAFKSLFEFRVLGGISELEDYLKITEKYLQLAKEEFEASANKQAEELSAANPELRPDEIWDILNDDYWRYDETYPRTLRSSFFVFAYSLLEYKMDIICKQLKKDKQINISWNDLKGSTLDQFKLYCKLSGLKLSYNSELWQEIRYYSLLCNCIVHNNGSIAEFKHEKILISYAKKKEIIDREMLLPSIRPWAVVALSEQFCKEVINTMLTFLKDVLTTFELKNDNGV